MKRELAQKLLSGILNWNTEEVVEYRELIEDLSELKYDLYQQYQPGSRFVENLSMWLCQFKDEHGRHNLKEARIAFDFLLKYLVFISPDEMYNLISIVYPDIIVPILKRQAKEIATVESIETKRIFRLLKRQSIFLGLSDGARTDIFRRSNPELSHEQICINYDLSDYKLKSVIQKMRKDTTNLSSGLSFKFYDINSIQNIFLLDDFTGSGISYLRKEDGKWDGKIAKILDSILSVLTKQIHIIIYLSSDKAIKYLSDCISEYRKTTNLDIKFHTVQRINSIQPGAETLSLMKKYYSDEIEDSSYLKGKHDNPYLGFDECSLPLVLYHNTPNNSFPILWSGKNSIFPRVTRHKDVII